jgi:hypothetical protein
MYNSGVKGFEPLDGDTKNRCLTTWRHPKRIYKNYTFILICTARPFHKKEKVLHFYTRNYFLEAKKVSVYAFTVVFKIVSPSSDNF